MNPLFRALLLAAGTALLFAFGVARAGDTQAIATASASNRAVAVSDPLVVSASAPSSPTPDPSPALPLRHGPEPGWPVGGIGASGTVLLALVLALLTGWAFWRRKGGTTTGNTPLSLRQWLTPQRDGVQVLQSVRLTGHASLHVVQWNGRQHLLGCNEHGIATIAARDQPATDPAVSATQGVA